MILSFVQHIIPMAVVIALGWLCARLKLFDETFTQGLTVFILYIALPALIFIHLAHGNIVQGAVNLHYVAAYVFVLLACLFSTWWVGNLLFKTPKATNILRALCATHPNLGVFGFPILSLTAGHGVLLPLVISNALVDSIELPVSIWMLESVRHKNKESGVLSIIFSSALRAFSKPLILAAILGVVWSYYQLPLNVQVSKSLGILANGTSACSLFLIGLLVYFQPCKINREVLFTTCSKLIFQPLLALLAIYLFHLHGSLAVMLILFSFIPTGVTPIILSQRYRAFQSNASATVVLTTILALPLISILVSQLNV